MISVKDTTEELIRDFCDLTGKTPELLSVDDYVRLRELAVNEIRAGVVNMGTRNVQDFVPNHQPPLPSTEVVRPPKEQPTEVVHEVPKEKPSQKKDESTKITHFDPTKAMNKPALSVDEKNAKMVNLMRRIDG